MELWLRVRKEYNILYTIPMKLNATVTFFILEHQNLPLKYPVLNSCRYLNMQMEEIRHYVEIIIFLET